MSTVSKKFHSKDILYPPGGILMWIIIYLELFTFGAVLVAMVFYSKDESELFHQSRLQLNATIGAINTLFLLVSGFFMALTVGALKIQNITNSKLYLKLTMLGGLLFLSLKTVEYFYKIDAGLTMGYNTFFSFYWMLTLFHVIHVFVGLVILASILRTMAKKPEKLILEDVEASATFWHMCDLIWLLLFPIIYLVF